MRILPLSRQKHCPESDTPTKSPYTALSHHSIQDVVTIICIGGKRRMYAWGCVFVAELEKAVVRHLFGHDVAVGVGVESSE
jgi:hypothetical protein